MSEETKKEIDNMSYKEMLSLWRNAPVEHSMFLGETGNYFAKTMKEKAAKISQSEKVAASKQIGWSGKTNIETIDDLK